jgi:hypothetical protein
MKGVMLDSRLCSEITSDLNLSIKSLVFRPQLCLRAIILILDFYKSFVSVVYVLKDGKELACERRGCQSGFVANGQD